MRIGYDYLNQNWNEFKPSKITAFEQNKFEHEMSKYAEGHHYQEFQNLFRRIKTRNDIMPFNDDQLISWELINDFLKDIQITTEEQALFDPPADNFKWPFKLKKDTI